MLAHCLLQRTLYFMLTIIQLLFSLCCSELCKLLFLLKDHPFKGGGMYALHACWLDDSSYAYH